MNVAINSSGGGSDSGYKSNGIIEKDITLEMSKIIKNILDQYGINTILLRDKDETISYDDRIKLLTNSFSKNDTIVISNTLNNQNGIDIIYPLKKDDKLASIIADNLSAYNTTKYYQFRYSLDPTKDYYYITRNTPGYNTIIIRYGNPYNTSDANIIKNKYKEMASSVAYAILDYLGIEEKIDNTSIYKVKSGDSLYSIAKKYNTTINTLKELNNLTGNTIYINQVLKVPSNKEYTIKSGDTLSEIAKKFNTSVSEIKKINNLTSDLIIAGKTLIIP